MSTFYLQLYYIYKKDQNARFTHEVLTFGVMALGVLALLWWNMSVGIAANNFVDIFEMDAFRGSFKWVEKLDWLGMIVQFVLSVFSVVGVCLMTIRIITSMLYISSKGLWEEVSDLKKTGGDNDMYDLGVLSQLKKVGQGKCGTGFDAVLGAILILLPDVKRYSDFSENSGGKFSEDISMSQYMLKIALPTIMAVFFFAMGFNGTLFKLVSVTVDAMGTVADKVVSQDYADMLDRLIVTGQAYQFALDSSGTQQGTFQGKLAKELYSKVLANIDGEITVSDSTIIGQTIESKVSSDFNSQIASTFANSFTLTPEELNADDENWTLVAYNIRVNNTPSYTGSGMTWKTYSIGELAGSGTEIANAAGQNLYFHIRCYQSAAKQTKYLRLNNNTGTGTGNTNF